ncbi:TRAP transporter small permease [Peribacillus cavernae]|uniref:TRAP transporter small permease n=1 Tax=Peribacillus cavernae TaxID=1674310 RepID=A0A433HRK0_9BACI|nr:TRAP transporter small permease [Peribacillus cavernae]MDQ0218687.1 TRAP-type C4-dicarboxylate transport system permease small subunit [Peribacillus cavernae]RUQ30908.1 TRAP transporter small permease [Peribacillus cavernae]
MKKTGKRLGELLNILNVSMLALMAILVFGNVVLRYAFNSGIMWSEEMSRFLFIWLCFSGAIGALKDNEHLGVDALIKKLSLGKKRLLYTLSNVIMLYILWLVFDGSWKVAIANLHIPSPVTGMPMFYIYITGVIVSALMACIIIRNLYKAWFVRDSIEDLIKTVESEEEILFTEEAKTAQGGGR